MWSRVILCLGLPAIDNVVTGSQQLQPNISNVTHPLYRGLMLRGYIQPAQLNHPTAIHVAGQPFNSLLVSANGHALSIQKDQGSTKVQ